MPKKLIHALWFAGLLLFIFVAYSAATFERKPLIEVQKSSVETPKQNPYVITDVIQNNVEIPIIDPSVCKDNPEGYIYFQIGDEVFRYTKDSPIKVSRINSGSEEKKGKDNISKEIPDGCKGNPYVNVILRYLYNNSDEPYKKINMKRFGVYEVPIDERDSVSVAQLSREDSYFRLKNNNKPCEFISDDLEKCFYPSDKDKKYWVRAYKTLSSSSLGRPFYFDCQSFVGDIECDTYYRLYPSFNFSYSFYIGENEDWDESSVINFDRYLRDTFESMRVTEKEGK